MRESVLKKYAKLIAVMGGNVRKGQEVIINAELDQPKFVEYVVEECYKAGASKVTVEWTHQPVSLLNVNYRSLETLSTVEKWEEEKMRHKVETLPVMIYIMSEDPDGLNGMDQEKNAKARNARYKVLKSYRDQMESKYQWCIAAVPGAAWAKKVFPGVSEKAAVEKLWKAILYTSRVIDENGKSLNPITEWKKHNADLAARCEYLNSLGISTLEYSASNGTSFKVGLIPNGVFAGGREKVAGKKNVWFNPNIPSEEVFTSPMKGKAEGIVYSSKPLSYCGQTIENFNIRFEDGKAVEVHAEKNEELLKKMISMDEGAAYLGECALIPFDSPICRSGITFINTLFDENAACHLALGMGFNNCIRDYEKYTLEQCREMGINDSVIHVDFMIGTEDLDIVAVTSDGKRVQIFKNGNWAF